MTPTLTADTRTLCISGVAVEPGSTVSLLLAGRRIWSFHLPQPDDNGSFRVRWPGALTERLVGWAPLGLQVDGEVVTEALVRFDDTDVELVLEQPFTRAPLILNKWEMLAPSFVGADESLITEVLDAAEDVMAAVRADLGIDLFITGGTLLGPVRDGRIMPSDDDADLAYLSTHDNPSDVALESYAMERALLARGYEIFRLSTGHLQLMFPGRSVSDRFYIDIFSYFVTEGWFYGTFHVRQPAERVPILPLQRLAVNGRPLLAPADPAALLEAIYGTDWRTPDPAFAFSTPPAALRRYKPWLGDLNMDRENWEQRHREDIAAGPAEASAFARAAGELLPRASTVLELGSGLGMDARHLAELGHTVLAVDYSRSAVAHARAAAPADARLRFEAVNLYSIRAAVALRRACADLDGPLQVYARSFFDALAPAGWDITFQLLSHLLRRPGTSAHLELETRGPTRNVRWKYYRPVDWSAFEARVEASGLEISDLQLGCEDEDGSTRIRLLVKGARW